MTPHRKDLGHISSATDWQRREKNRAEIEAARAADPWPWLEELLAWSKSNGSTMTTRWDPPPIHSHRQNTTSEPVRDPYKLDTTQEKT